MEAENNNNNNDAVVVGCANCANFYMVYNGNAIDCGGCGSVDISANEREKAATATANDGVANDNADTNAKGSNTNPQYGCHHQHNNSQVRGSSSTIEI